MAPTNQASQDPGLAQPPSNPPQVQASQPQAGVPPTIPPASDMSNVHLTGGFDQNQIMSLLRHLPNVFGKVSFPFMFTRPVASTPASLLLCLSFFIYQCGMLFCNRINYIN